MSNGKGGASEPSVAAGGSAARGDHNRVWIGRCGVAAPHTAMGGAPDMGGGDGLRGPPSATAPHRSAPPHSALCPRDRRGDGLAGPANDGARAGHLPRLCRPLLPTGHLVVRSCRSPRDRFPRPALAAGPAHEIGGGALPLSWAGRLPTGTSAPPLDLHLVSVPASEVDAEQRPAVRGGGCHQQAGGHENATGAVGGDLYRSFREGLTERPAPLPC